ncbi:MAG: hypothetical protein M3P06_25900 [Acidobacteriota bacterium]|nr:hypothetical protein [Acidobacteriota bacterium]
MNVFRFLALLLILAAASRPSSLSSDKGMGLDPNGRPAGATGDHGAGIDPNG